MDATFISIHDVTPDARILYSSDSVIDILGYTPDEIVNRSCWDFFPADELPYAKAFHQKRVTMDKAAVLAYCRVKSKSGAWIGCECCFTIVYDCMIVCTSVYERSKKSEDRAIAAPLVRRLFTSSPQDPRYHMLSHLSAKFNQPSKPLEHEPRAALFLNRFTRSLTVMYATDGIRDILGLSAEEMRGKSFYYCVAQNCLPDAIKCLENAKGNDSIAYLRFWFRDPRPVIPVPAQESAVESDEEMTTDISEDGGVGLQNQASADSGHSSNQSGSTMRQDSTSMDVDEPMHDSRASSGDSTRPADTHEQIFGLARPADSSMSSTDPSPTREQEGEEGGRDPVELEAVISCASDGLVVCLRRARPMIPHPTQRPSQPVYSRGLFAAPWATDPILPPIESRPGAGYNSGFAPSLGPLGARHEATAHRTGGPDSNDFMAAIRDQAIFAWALTGINGMLAEYGKGSPSPGAVPEDGLPVWTSDTNTFSAIQNGDDTQHEVNGNGWTADNEAHQDSSDIQRPVQIFGDPGLPRQSNTGDRPR